MSGKIMRDLVRESRISRGLTAQAVDLDVGQPVAAVAGPQCGRGLTNCLGMTLAACALCGRGHGRWPFPTPEPTPRVFEGGLPMPRIFDDGL